MNLLTTPTADMDTRFQDNLSPEPSDTTDLAQNCFKTPNINTFNSILSLNNGLYPTPPSDNEEHYHQQGSFYTQYYEGINSTDTSTNTYQHSPELAKNLYQTSFYSSPESTGSVHNQDQAPPASAHATSRFKRRSRTTFSKSQVTILILWIIPDQRVLTCCLFFFATLKLEILEKTFQKSQYPEIKTVDDLCDMLHLSTERVSIWFQNRRARFKKQRKLQAQSAGYATKDIEKSLNLPSATSYQVSVPQINTPANKYEYDNRMYPMAYATPPHFYTDSVAITKIENSDESTAESVYGTSPTPILNQQFYPQQPIYYDTSAQAYAYQNNLLI